MGSRSRAGRALAARWVGARRQEILAWLRFPPTRAVARILARIQPPALSAESALQLLITPTLLAAVSRARRERDHAHCAEHLAGALAMADELGRDLSRRRFRDPARIAALHDELASAYAREHEGELLRCRFGRPPFPGTPELVPLTTPRQLIEEGRLMRNCVAGYAPRVEKRRAYVYRVMRPERATLALTRAPSGAWKVGELYRAGNAWTTGSPIKIGLLRVRRHRTGHTLDSPRRQSQELVDAGAEGPPGVPGGWSERRAPGRPGRSNRSYEHDTRALEPPSGTRPHPP